MHVLITGHTGFKGAWLALMLVARGHRVSGIALDPHPGSLFDRARLGDQFDGDHRIDIRDATSLADAFAASDADAVVHLAAQPLVKDSYRDPRTTVETNVMGTYNVLEATRRMPRLRALLVITTDKVYRNVGRRQGYREHEALGAADPYSTSKAMADLLTQSWVTSFPGPATAIARAGNVVGGGDHSRERLLPDLMRAFAAGEPALIRFPQSVRPWQHVMDCNAGYLALLDALLEGRGDGEWNIGPGAESFVTVGAVADLAARTWGADASWRQDTVSHTPEATLLALDSSRARRDLAWSDALTYPACIEWAVDWHRRVDDGADAREVTMDQIAEFGRLAAVRG